MGKEEYYSSLGFLDWKYVSEAEIYALEEFSDQTQLKLKLKQIFGLHLHTEEPKKVNIAVDLYFHAYIFCKARAFNAHKSATFLSILCEMLTQDFQIRRECQSLLISMSFRSFQGHLLKHSVARSPKSIQIFDPIDVEAIFDYVLNRCIYNSFIQS